MDIDSVMESIQDIYKKIYSNDYDEAKKWVKICFNMDVNDCNRAGLMNDINPNQYWRETSDPCMSKLYKYGGGKENGLANPKNNDKWSYGMYGSLKEGLTQNEFWTKQRNPNANFRENQTEHEIYGSSGSGGGLFKFGKDLSHRDYVKSIKNLVKMKNMSNEEAKKVHSIYSSETWAKPKFSNANWVDKYTSAKLINGETLDYPVDESKQCWPEFARRMLTHPKVKLKDLKTLDFKNATEFHSLSFKGNNSLVDKNLRKQGSRVFEGGPKYYISQETYDKDTFPFWKYLSVGSDYWRQRWDQFKKILIDYADTDQTTYQDIVRPINEKEAEEIARAYGYKIGGKGYSFGGNYGTKGLYLYRTGRYNGRCYFGRGGSKQQQQSNIGYPKVRVDWNQNQQVLRFLPKSRFYNALPATTKIRNTWKKPYFFEYKNKDNDKVRVLFSSAYKIEGFPYYKFLKQTIKN